MPQAQLSKREYKSEPCNPLHAFIADTPGKWEQTASTLRSTFLDMGHLTLRFLTAIDNMPVAVCLFGHDGAVEICNTSYRQLFALPKDVDFGGVSLRNMLGCSRLKDRDKEPFQPHFLEYEALGFTSAARHKLTEMEQTWPDGRVICISRLNTDDGGWLDIIVDLTSRREAEALVRYMANYDSLTDLPNRNLFQIRLAEAVSSAGKGGASAVLCIDLDNFKVVNDTLGHPVGDALLREVAKRLKAGTRPYDFAARFGGDEFVIIVNNVRDPDEVITISERLIEDLSAPYFINEQQVLVGASIGIEFIWNDAVCVDELIRNADLALYHAKSEGRGRLAVYNTRLHETRDSRRQMELDLRRALELDEFVLHYQPQICNSKGTVCGFESLVRWNRAGRGLVSPGAFIGVCEEIGLIHQLGAWVLRRACEDALTLPDEIAMAVNVSPVQFREPGFPEIVRKVLNETGLRPERLELEITESVMIADTGAALETLEELKSLGVCISLDDFGTGFSSLSSVRRFPFDKLKIDQSFIRDLGCVHDSLPIVQAVAEMCARMGITVLAEGVESAEQYAILKGLTCDGMQGYLFGRPMPFEAAQTFVDAVFPQ